MQAQTEDDNSTAVGVVLVNMSGMFRELLCSAFTNNKTVHIVACAANDLELSTALDVCYPNVALVGIQGWARDMDALPFLQQIASTAPNVRTIVIASEMSRENVVSLFHSGARGLICASEADIPLLTKCIQCVSKGQIWASASQLELLIRSLSSPRSLKVTNVLGDSLLSKREEQVLHFLADGMSNRELAVALKLSEHTVKNHLFRIFDKLGVSNRMEAVLFAISQREQRNAFQLSRTSPALTRTKREFAPLPASNRAN